MTAARRAIIYVRVSTAEQATSGLGTAAQIERCRAYTAWRGIEACEVSENGIRGTLAPEDRPALGSVLAELAGTGGADMLIVAKLDRLGRDVLALAERAEREGWSLVVHDLDIDTSTAGGKLVLTMFAALAAKKAQGARLGRPVEVAPATAARIQAARAAGHTLQGIADELNAAGITTPRGAVWKRAGIARVLRSLDLDAEARASDSGGLSHAFRNSTHHHPVEAGGLQEPRRACLRVTDRWLQADTAFGRATSMAATP